MEAKQVINIAGTTCPPESDLDFNKWFEERHIPKNMKFNGLMGVTLYQLVRFTESAIVKNYPRFMTTYKFKDLPTLAAWNDSPELREASEGVAELFARFGVDSVWWVQYEFIKTWEKTPLLSVVTIVGTECRLEAEFDRWYSEKHIPDLLKFKGLQGATRYQLASYAGPAYPKYLTFYYFKDTADADAYDASPERLATHEEWFGVMKEMGVTLLWRAQYKPMRTWQR